MGQGAATLHVRDIRDRSLKVAGVDGVFGPVPLVTPVRRRNRDPRRRIDADDLALVSGMVGLIPNLTAALMFTPLEEGVEHPYKSDGPGPALSLQLRFPDLFTCETAAGRNGILAQLAAGIGVSSLTGLEVTHQVMVTRAFPVEVAEHALDLAIDRTALRRVLVEQREEAGAVAAHPLGLHCHPLEFALLARLRRMRQRGANSA